MKVRLTIDFDTETENLAMNVQPNAVGGRRALLYGILGLAKEAVTVRGIQGQLKSKSGIVVPTVRINGGKLKG